ncbi:HD domain-containing protein [Candidatus Nanohalococcus occultus]|uniref:HD superfamily phosphohydrolase n=1 Tax=Candidatus Nanohalococcus occultus TaxID=2978047 RepID=A0ABY8CF03_9ARCH|nr:HD superfamily phosphohydrolase [Candidatus Nanohaloarchaeota archaeon SVXNc]
MKHVKDALHGYIELNDQEQRVVDSPQVQRLRRIRQLGLSSLVYPSATHTRFQHSLGVTHLAGRFAESLDLDDQRRQELRIAALLHDSGHGPFSHASELVMEKEGYSHEDFSCKIVDQLEDCFEVDAGRVKRIIKGELEIGQAVAGEIDADRMDYLMRDAHSSGLEHGHIDASTIIRLAEIDSRRLVFDSKAIDALEGLFTSRFHMIKTLYTHHAVNIAEKMLQRALEDYVSDVEKQMRMDDYEMHNALMNSSGESKEIYSKVKERKLYKRCLDWDRDKLTKEQLKTLEKQIKDEKKIEEEIAETAGVESSKVIVDAPSTPRIKEINVKVKKNGFVKDLTELSPVPEALSKAEWRTVKMEVYCEEGIEDDVSEAAEEVLEKHTNAINEYLD